MPSLLALALFLLLVAACQAGGQPLIIETPSPSIETAVPSPTARPMPVASPTATGDQEVVLAAVGDVMLGRSIGEGILDYGPSYPFEFLAQALREADIAFANLESPITDGGTPADKDFVFRAPPAAVQGLAEAGIDVVSFANNHALDYGLAGFLDTLEALEGAGIAYAGAGQDLATARRPVILEVKGLRLAFLAYVNTPDDSVSGFRVAMTAAEVGKAGVAWANLETIGEDVARVASQVDIVVVSLHAGFEYQEGPNPLQVELAHTAIDAGADLVLGHHPHVLQGIEEYGGGLIAYSLGNFVFDFDAIDYAQPGLPSSLSLILRVRLGREGVRGYDLLPVVIAQEDGRPRLASGEEARAVEERIRRVSAILGGD